MPRVPESISCSTSGEKTWQRVRLALFLGGLLFRKSDANFKVQVPEVSSHYYSLFSLSLIAYLL